jgi:hypothetical protein
MAFMGLGKGWFGSSQGSIPRLAHDMFAEEMFSPAMFYVSWASFLPKFDRTAT